MALPGLSPPPSAGSSRFRRHMRWRYWRIAVADALSSGHSPFILWSPVVFASGVGCYFLFPAEPPQALIHTLSGVSGAAWLLARRHSGGAATALAVLALFFIGLMVAQWRTERVAAPALGERLGPVWVEGRLLAVEVRDRGLRLTLDSIEIENLSPEMTPGRVRITTRQAMDEPLAGQTIRLRAVLHPPPPPAMPGGFDFQRRAYFERLGAVGYAIATPRILAPTDTKSDGLSVLSLALSGLRQDIAARIRIVLPGETGAVAAALLTGLRGAIREETWQAMRDSGLAHLLAISGLHMGMAAAFAFWVSRALFACSPFLALRYPIKKWAAFIALGASLIYLLLTGATVPTQRAFAMTGLVLFAVLADRVAVSMRLVALAALLVLFLAPESLLGPSFQMSFAAVAALVAVYDALRRRAGERIAGRRKQPPLVFWSGRVATYIGGVALTTLVASAATAPFALYHFNRLAVYGLLANLAGVPVAAFWIMPCGLIALAAMPFGLEGIFLQAMGGGVAFVLDIAEAIAGLSGAAWPTSGPTAWGLVMAVFGGLWLCLWSGLIRWLGIPAIILGLISALYTVPPHILIDGQARLIAARLDSGETSLWAVSSLKTAKRTREEWVRRTAAHAVAPWSDYEVGYAPGHGPPGLSVDHPAVSDLAGLQCDSLGCLYRAEGMKVALALKADALQEDCRRADLVIALVPVRGSCPAPLGVIDRFDLWRNGAYAVWLHGKEAEIVSVADMRGDRPWVIGPGD